MKFCPETASFFLFSKENKEKVDKKKQWKQTDAPQNDYDHAQRKKNTAYVELSHLSTLTSGIFCQSPALNSFLFINLIFFLLLPFFKSKC